ncbi:superoxide dismutase [Apibacter sp. HY039]|uniref:superoxide dismutase n=1 Tax=Apibacter sp. HY039 TaxID=2501476 RepID=UPI000FEB6F17|nr:superoxide dismutase [Apibacter sp. HY039]
MKIKTIFLTTLLLFALKISAQFSLPKLDYSYDALQPHIDSTTMRIHYTKHHAAYVNNLNAAIQKYPQYSKKTVEELIMNLNNLPDDIRTAVRNNGGGHYNHSLFWTVLTPENNSKPEGEVVKAIEKKFGSLDTFKAEFDKAAASRFGSGWAWLIVDKDGKLKVTSTANQDNPLMDIADLKGVPVLGLDVWEHAYYLSYQNRRADYIKSYWSIVNWKEVNKRYLAALKKK